MYYNNIINIGSARVFFWGGGVCEILQCWRGTCLVYSWYGRCEVDGLRVFWADVASEKLQRCWFRGLHS